MGTFDLGSASQSQEEGQEKEEKHADLALAEQRRGLLGMVEKASEVLNDLVGKAEVANEEDGPTVGAGSRGGDIEVQHVGNTPLHELLGAELMQDIVDVLSPLRDAVDTVRDSLLDAVVLYGDVVKRPDGNPLPCSPGEAKEKGAKKPAKDCAKQLADAEKQWSNFLMQASKPPKKGNAATWLAEHPLHDLEANSKDLFDTLADLIESQVLRVSMLCHYLVVVLC